jgi:hypothetical protein
MELLIGIVIVLFLYYHFVLSKNGKLDFWKVAQARPELAYSFFSLSPAFIVFENEMPAIMGSEYLIRFL